MADTTGKGCTDPSGLSIAIDTIDITDHSDPNQKPQTCPGIYEVNGDKYQVTFAPAGKARPTTFSTTPDSGNWSHTWKRVTE